MPDFIPNNDQTFRGFLINFITEATANQATLKLTAQELTDLQAAVDGFVVDLDAYAAAFEALKGLMVNRNASRKTAEGLVRKYNKRFRTVPVGNSLLADLGLPVYDTERTKAVPVTPTNLTAKANLDGTVNIRFSRAGNASSVLFNVETSAQTTGPWTVVVTKPSTRIKLNGFEPGETAYFRVLATANGLSSAASNTAVIYSDVAPTPLRVAA